MSKIKDLTKIQSHQRVVYSATKELINEKTGEVSTTEKFTIAKEKTKDNFIKVFVENIKYLIDLENHEKSLFFIVLSRLNYKNLFFFDKGCKKSIIDGKFLSRSSMYRAFDGLLEKGVLIKIDSNDDILNDMMINSDDVYLVNPNIVGKGSWLELKNLRHTISYNYDFEKLEATKEIIQDARYEGYEEITENLESHEVKQISQYASEDGKHIETEIVIGEKDQNKGDIIDIEPAAETISEAANNQVIGDEPNLFSGLEDDTENEPKLLDSKAYDLQILTERRKLIEAENENMRLKLKLQGK
ncbi:TPA: replication/maintenance protein RepL [Campylobacter fetus subsp. venerealis]|nr:replication/maintenance protein RepL [Campylobacter fetus subsp. venerealis]HDX6324039.1 replication/maintenance protein RepL [Campylobacter fetus subsp. venerealis]